MAYHVRIKICGITHAADGERAAVLGADAIGLNFYNPSARYVDPETAAVILQRLPPFVDAVGLFVNQPPSKVSVQLVSLARVRTVQLHGDLGEWENAFPLAVIPAFSVRDADSLADIHHYLDRCRESEWAPSAILVDAYVPGRHGGTGQSAPWELLADFEPAVPLILAGGLTPENVAEAIRIVRPYAVDVASGVEQTPGRKDAQKMSRFIGNAREAAAKLTQHFHKRSDHDHSHPALM